jgi:lysophospholipase L1-like esterase
VEPAAPSAPSRSAERATRVTATAVALTLALVAAACGGSENHATPRHRLSIVVLGDSVAAGEGIAYGYTYAADARPPRWTGGVADPVWLQPDPGCHRTAAAYGNVVAAALHGRLTNLACTGASYDHGIVGPEDLTGDTPQFGDWARRENLNPAYDRAAADVVLVTFGADDLQFVRVVISCVRASLLRPDECVAGNPGSVVQHALLDALPTLTAHYRALASAIRERAAAHHHKAPSIVFTNYYDPLPAPGADTSVFACPDAAGLSGAQIQFLRSLIDELDATITDALRGERGVEVADLHHLFDGHQWCSPDPWAYGPSVLLDNPASQAPFHPTAQGQRLIAARILTKLGD